ncbi:unnamed protein product [Mycena citricolor]|uniref:Uncharacterized protein n=2 Tax=Mycena citricolor TaxID=2018698 RepID=A0AAD2K6Y2_9AGAR|nr:unnamed protein product [Mycena citricolor]
MGTGLICANRRCRGIESYHQFFFIITQVMTAVMLILRTYALYERNKRVLIFMMMVTAGAIVVGMWAVIAGKAGRTEENLQLYFGCNYGLTKSDATSQAASWAAVALFDCMIFTLTLYRVLSRRTTTTDLFSVLLRDGSIYFGVIVISNVSNILTFTLGTPYTRGIATTFTNILSSVLISRLMLNLRDPKLSYMSGRFEQSTTLTYGGPIRFADSTSPSGAQPLDTEFAMGATMFQTRLLGALLTGWTDIEMLNTTSNAGTSNQTPGMA